MTCVVFLQTLRQESARTTPIIPGKHLPRTQVLHRDMEGGGLSHDRPARQTSDRMLRVSRWAECDPLSAAGWVEKTTGGELRRKLLKVIAASFAESDLQSSIAAWADGLGAASEREAVLREIIRQAAVSDPRAALEIAGRITDEEQCREAVLECLREWARHDPLQAAEHTGRLPGPVSRDEALAAVASARASRDPAGAATLAAREIRDEAAFSRALPALLSEAAKSDPSLMEEWVRSFADGPVKELARAELARIRRGLHPSPASLPGEAVEDRSPSRTKQKNNHD